MGQYTPTVITAGTADLVTKLNANFNDIATAHNSHASGDFGSGVVPITALAAGNYTYTLELSPSLLAGSDTCVLTAGLTTATVLDEIVCPRDSTVVSVKLIAKAVSGGTPTVDVFRNGVSILSSAISLAAANTAYSGSVTTTTANVNDIYSLRATTAGGVTATGVRLVIELKAQLTT